MKNSRLSKLDLFFAQFKPRHYKKGETILRAGDVPPGVFYLKRGYARDYTISKEGEELTLIIFKPGDIFPIPWAINNLPNQHYFQAMTPVVLQRALRENFLKFIRSDMGIFFELTSRILTHFGGLLTRMEYLVFGNASNKVASILLICAERFGKKQGRNTIIQVPLTHNDIASLVGMTRETASIEMKKLEEKGLIVYRGRMLVIRNLERLKRRSLVDTWEG